MPFAFVSDNASFPFQSQGLINLFLNWKFCLSTCFLRTQLSGHRKTKAMAASASSAGHSTFESVAFLADSLPWQKGWKAQTASWSLLYRVLILTMKAESLQLSHFHIFMPPGGSNFNTGMLEGHVCSNHSTLSSQSSLCSCGQLGRR